MIHFLERVKIGKTDRPMHANSDTSRASFVAFNEALRRKGRNQKRERKGKEKGDKRDGGFASRDESRRAITSKVFRL